MKTYKVICEETCPMCEGTGFYIKDSQCTGCNGTGTIRFEVDLEQALVELDRKHCGQYIEDLKTNIAG
mgnify:CR=1 FL=1